MMTIARKDDVVVELPRLTPAQVHDTWQAVANMTESARLAMQHSALPEFKARYDELVVLRQLWYELDKRYS